MGTLAGGEVWSVNPNFGIFDETGSSWDQESGDAIVQALLPLSPGVNVLNTMSTAVALTGYRLEGRDDADGSLLGVAEGFRTSPLLGTGSPNKPPQSAMVLSLRSSRPGASGRGRLYWPTCSVSLTASNWRIPTAVVEAFTNELRGYLRSIQDTIKAEGGFGPTTSVRLIVRSKTLSAESQVNRVQAGDILDVQRRRRDKLRENYSSVDYPGA